MSDPFQGMSELEIRRLVRRKVIQNWVLIVVGLAIIVTVLNLLVWS